MGISTDRRLGIAGLLVAAFGIAITILWPNIRWLGWIFLLFGVLGAFVWIFAEIKIRSERREAPERKPISGEPISEFRAPNVPEISLVIHDVVMHRTGDGNSRFRYGELLVQASAQTKEPTPVTVSYSAQLVFRGTVVELERLDDLHQWEIIERKYYDHLGSRPRREFVMDPPSLSTNLATIKSEGWLHFRVDGMPETQIAKRTLRLYANTPRGSTHADRELAQDHVVRSDLVAMRKYAPTPQS